MPVVSTPEGMSRGLVWFIASLIAFKPGENSGQDLTPCSYQGICLRWMLYNMEWNLQGDHKIVTINTLNLILFKK